MDDYISRPVSGAEGVAAVDRHSAGMAAKVIASSGGPAAEHDF